MTYLAPALEIITFFTGFFEWYDGFIYPFIFNRLILHNNSKDNSDSNEKKINQLGSASASFMPVTVFSLAEMPHYSIWHPIVSATVC